MLDSEVVLFERAGERFVPTALCGSPWTREALHGGPPAALLGRAIEQFEGGDAMFVARITLELLRPVPLEPLRLETRLVRPGRKVQLIEASLHSDKQEVARATGLRIRQQDLVLPDGLQQSPVTMEPPESGRPSRPDRVFVDGFHSHAVEHRFLRSSFGEPGPGTDWVRLKFPLLRDEALTPLQRVCAAADFGNGVSGILPGTHTYINPDLTIYLFRYPRGEWVCLDAVTRVAAHGVGLAESMLLDTEGVIGRSAQSLIIEARG